MEQVLAAMLLCWLVFPRLAAEWYVKFEAHLRKERAALIEKARKKKIRERAIRIKKIRQNRWASQEPDPS